MRLYYSFGRLTEVPLEILEHKHNPEVTEIDLAFNNLSEIPKWLFEEGNFPNLQILYLFNNKITHLPSNLFQSLSNLKALYLHNNRLTHLPSDIFQSLSNLVFLRLQNNRLTHLPSNLNRNILGDKEETLKEIEEYKGKRQKFREEIEAEVKNREEKRVRRNLRVVLVEIECMPPNNYYFEHKNLKAFENFKGKHFQDLYESNPFAS